MIRSEFDLPDGRWFLKDDSRDLWQFFESLDMWQWKATCFYRHGEPWRGAREYAITEGFILDDSNKQGRA